MALLSYDIQVVGMKRVEQAFASIERRFAQHNARVNRTLGVPTAPGGAARGGRPKTSELAHGLDQIGRAARAADLKQSRDRERAEHRLHQTRLRNIEKEAQAAIRAEQRAAAAAHRNAANSRRSFARGTMGVMRGAAGTIASVGRAGVGLVGIGGSMAAGVAISTEMRERAKASQLANQAGNPALKGQLLQDARGVKGFSGEEALGGMEAFVTKTGDLETARKIIGDLGTLSLATGANLEDLGETAGQAFNVLRDQIKDPKQQLVELNGIMTALAQQGNMGAVEIKDLAKDFGKLGAATRGFEGGAPALLRTMGAFAQMAVARGGAESSADASTASARLVGDIVTNKKKFKKLGVGIKSATDPTKLRDPLAIMQDVLQKTGGDVEKTSGLFGIESAKIFKGLSAVYSEAEKTKKGSGRGAVDAEFNRFAGANMSQKDLQDRAQSQLSEPAVQLKEAMKELNATIGPALLPALVTLVGKLRDASPELGKFAQVVAKAVGMLAENPWAGVGAVVGGAIAKQIAAAGISAAIKKAFETAGAGNISIATAALAIELGTIQLAKQAKEDFQKTTLEDLGAGRAILGRPDATRGELEAVREGARDRRKEVVNRMFSPFGKSAGGIAATIAGTIATGGALPAAAGLLTMGKDKEIVRESRQQEETAGARLQGVDTFQKAVGEFAAAVKGGNGPNRGDSPTTPTK